MNIRGRVARVPFCRATIHENARLLPRRRVVAARRVLTRSDEMPRYLTREELVKRAKLSRELRETPSGTTYSYTYVAARGNERIRAENCVTVRLERSRAFAYRSVRSTQGIAEPFLVQTRLHA